MQKESKEFAKKIAKERLNKARNERLDFLWNDFLGAVEKVINMLSDEELAATDWITIFYEIKKNGRAIYRSKMAGICCTEDERIEYESEDINLGSKKLLEVPFRDFRNKAKQDNYFLTNWFEIEKLFEYDGPEIIELSFCIDQMVEIETKKSADAKYKVISEINAKPEKI